MVPSGIAPQFTAIYFPCFRELLACIICGKNSFPAPLSPVISTAKSIGAICRALCNGSNQTRSISYNAESLFGLLYFCRNHLFSNKNVFTNIAKSKCRTK